MEDHHVDRPGVEAQQCVKLTGTNRSIGLISHHTYEMRTTMIKPAKLTQRFDCIMSLGAAGDGAVAFRRLGGYSEGATPDPIPNSAVKDPQRRWYCVLRRGRVGRRQVFKRGWPKSDAITSDETNIHDDPVPTRSSTVPGPGRNIPLTRGGAVR